MFAICTVSLTAAHIDKHKNIFLAGVRPITIPWNYINFRSNLCWVTGTYTAYTKSHSYLLPTGTDSYCSKALSLSLFHWKLVLTWFFFFPIRKRGCLDLLEVTMQMLKTHSHIFWQACMTSHWIGMCYDETMFRLKEKKKGDTPGSKVITS